MTDNEQWRPIPGYEGQYSASTLGRIRSEERIIVCRDGRQRRSPQRILKGCRSKDQPYLRVQLGNRNGKYIHHLVAETYHGPRPEGLDVLHANDIHDDNREANLSYGTRSVNLHQAVANGRHALANRTHCPKKHPYDEDNTLTRYGRRFCRACKRDRKRQENANKRQKTAERNSAA